MSAASRHNAFVQTTIRGIVYAANSQTSEMAVIVESLLLGVALLHFPADPRKQALLIQEIADGAADRVTSVKGAQ